MINKAPSTAASSSPQTEPPATGETENRELLRFITCGSVDDGKSTLIGRLLLECGAIYEDQLVALQRDSDRHGTTGDEIDPALLLDGLEDERKQGITIDVAYRYFSTPRRKFIIADTPGHEQFTRNMATGASTAELALILVDASKGLLTQTRRHAFIVSLLGIRHVIVAINKMDLVDYSQEVFEKIREEFTHFARKLEIPDLRFIPLSARFGDNLVEPSPQTHWYQDGSLLHQLETIYTGGDRNRRDLRFPVQWVNRPNASFRGFSGTIASGTLRVGDPIRVLPSGKESRVRSLVTMDGNLSEAEPGRSVTVTLEDEIDITRGDMLVRPGNLPHQAREAEAILLWMSETGLQPGRGYWCKQTSRRTSATVESIRYAIDVNTLHRNQADTLGLNEIGRCHLSFHDPLMFDPYRRNRTTGSFILVDRITHETVAAGMLLDHQPGRETVESSADSVAAPGIKSLPHRLEAWQQQPTVVAFGGSRTPNRIALIESLEQQLSARGHVCLVIDETRLRGGLASDLGRSAASRSEAHRRAGHLCEMLAEQGVLVLLDLEQPDRRLLEGESGRTHWRWVEWKTDSSATNPPANVDQKNETPAAERCIQIDSALPEAANELIDWLARENRIAGKD